MTERSEQLFALLAELGPADEIRIRYTEVRVPGGRVGHGIGRDGQRHLLVPLAAGDNRTEDRTSRGVTMAVRRLADDQRSTVFLDVACELPELKDLFAEVCDEMLLRLKASPGVQPGPICRNVLQRWRSLLAPDTAELMGRERLAGLLTELHFLELAVGAEPDLAMRTWTGWDGARHDFTGSTVGVEAKATTSRERLTVEIHGLDQLDPGPLSELYLYVEQLEPVPFDGDSVPDAIGRLVDSGVDQLTLMRNLAEVGYSHADSGVYTQLRFRCLQKRAFDVMAPRFPRLIRADLREPTLADRINRVRYSIDLAGSEYAPASLSDTASVVARLTGASP